MWYQTVCPSPVGALTLASDGEQLIGLWIEGQKYFGGAVRGEPVRREDLPVFGLTRRWLDRYFAGARPAPSELPLAPRGGAFRRTVWDLLCQIPYGEVTTYGRLAKQTAVRLGIDSMSAQAVGGAVSHNPISIVIPCHRVVGADGSLTGYAGGLETKRYLLCLEGTDPADLRTAVRGAAW